VWGEGCSVSGFCLRVEDPGLCVKGFGFEDAVNWLGRRAELVSREFLELAYGGCVNSV